MPAALGSTVKQDGSQSRARWHLAASPPTVGAMRKRYEPPRVLASFNVPHDDRHFGDLLEYSPNDAPSAMRGAILRGLASSNARELAYRWTRRHTSTVVELCAESAKKNAN